MILSPPVEMTNGVQTRDVTTTSEYVRLKYNGWVIVGVGDPPDPYRPNVKSVNGQYGPNIVLDFEGPLASKQPLATTLTQLAELDPDDGQVPLWSDTLGEYVAENIPGGIRVGANRNVTSTTTAMTAAVGVSSGVGTTVVVPSSAISVEDTAGRPAVIKLGAAFSQTAVGVCALQMFIYETTAGSEGIKATFTMSMPGLPLPIHVPAWEWDGLGVVTTTRTFELRCRLYTSSAAMSGYLVNTEANPTFMRAVTE